MEHPQDESLGKRLAEAQCAALNVLLLSSHSIGCLRVFASGLSRIKRSTGTVETPLVVQAMAKATLCREASAVLDGVYSDTWSLLVDANRPPPGQPLAFQKVYEMARALCASLDRVLPSTPESDTVDLVIAAARYQLCTSEEASALWTAINQEFAIAGNKYGIRIAPIRHPEADTMAQVDAMMAPLLRDAHESWEEPTVTPDQGDSASSEKQNEVTAPGAHGDGAILSRVAKALCAEVESIHRLRLGRTTSRLWKNELASQMPPDIVALRQSLDDARSAISDLGYEEHSLKSGQLSTTFLARFDDDHAAATTALPKLIEEAHASYCGVLLKIVDTTLTLLESDRSMDNYMETARLSESFAHLTATEWEDLEMSIRSEAARIGMASGSQGDDEHDDSPGSQATMTGVQCAKMIGIDAATLSRWRSKTPKWARGSFALFEHLMDRDNHSHYLRDRVVRLRAWYEKAMRLGLGRETDCP